MDHDSRDPKPPYLSWCGDTSNFGHFIVMVTISQAWHE